MRYLFLILLLGSVSKIQSQAQNDYTLRLEPVWSRVADAMGELGSVESAEFSPDGKYIVSGTKFDYSVILWRTSDGHELWRKYAAQEIERVGWSSDNQYVAACSEDRLVTIYEATTGKIVQTLQHSEGIDGLTWSNNGLTLVTGEEESKSAAGKKQGWIRFFELPSGKELRTIDFGGTINELLLSHDDQYLLAAGHGAVKIYEAKSGKLLQTLKPDRFFKFVTASFSPDAKHVIAGGFGGTMFVWEWRSGNLLREFNHTAKKVETVSWHPNGRYIAMTGHEPYIRIYRVADILKYKSERIPIAHRSWAGDHAEYIDFNTDGSFLVSAHQNGLIKLWAWMGEDPDINDRRHQMVKQVQKDYNEKIKNQ